MSRLRGRFEGGVDELMRHYGSSLDVDLEMATEDVEGSRAHARMLGEVGLLTTAEVERLLEGLAVVGAELADGTFRPGPELEDIHMAVEARLHELVGEVAGKLHTARSRNDQVATDVRLWLKRRLQLLDQAVGELVASFVDRVERDGQILMPGYTHLQRGQPILLGHHLLAHAWAFQRDRERLQGALSRVDRSPLGAAAMAGSPHPIDRDRSAALLGFAGVVENAMDAVSARDHEQEAAAACAILAGHLSRVAEELVIWSSSEFRFVRLGDGWATGSSIMPQKRNPDAAELIRGKAARVIGDAVTLLVLTKNLPLAYNRDLQEDRRALFDAVRTTLASVSVLTGVMRDLTFAADRFEAELAGDPALATELADALAASGVPFREAHEVVAQLAADLERKGRRFDQLTLEELRSRHPAFPDDAISRWLDPRAAVGRRRSRGGTASGEVERQVGLLRSGR